MIRSPIGLKVRGGLTLMELVVVLTVLIALASILIPMLPGMLSRAHSSSQATNNSELTKFVQTHEQLYLAYPDNLDALTDATGTAVADYLPGATVGQMTPLTLDASQAASLSAGGINNLAAMYATAAALPSGQDPTFNPYTGASISVANGANVVQLTEAAVEPAVVVQNDPNSFGDVYVVFGVGRANTMVGKTMSQAPLHFGEGGNDTPGRVYSRLGLVFRIARGTGTVGTPASTPLGRAQFVGTVSFHGDGITTGEGHITEYYEATQQ